MGPQISCWTHSALAAAGSEACPELAVSGAPKIQGLPWPTSCCPRATGLPDCPCSSAGAQQLSVVLAWPLVRVLVVWGGISTQSLWLSAKPSFAS